MILLYKIVWTNLEDYYWNLFIMYLEMYQKNLTIWLIYKDSKSIKMDWKLSGLPIHAKIFGSK